MNKLNYGKQQPGGVPRKVVVWVIVLTILICAAGVVLPKIFAH